MAECCAYTVKILHECLVSPPSGSVPTTHLPLSYFDLLWVRAAPTRRVFFYEFPHSTAHFTDALLPSLKQSLSLALQQFFPFSANLIFPPQPQKPHILYTPQDSLALTIAESDPSHFHAFVADHAKDAKHVYQLFQQNWPKFRFLSDGTQVIPLLELQLTIFPYQGLSIGVSFLHVAVDGPAFHHFIKSWTSICAGKHFDGPLPFHDRTVVQDTHGLESTFLQLQWSNAGPINFESETTLSERLADKVRATFLLSKSQIEGVRKWGGSQIISKSQQPESPHFSTFVITCSLVWVSFLLSREGEGEGKGASEVCDNDELYCFAFAADCRNRLGYPLPSGYFGNCLTLCCTPLKKSELLGENGMIMAMKALRKRVREVEDAPLKDTIDMASIRKKFMEPGVVFGVAGSPRLGAYDTDFGWGKPIKTEVVHIDSGKIFSLGESRNEKGGIEVGLVVSTSHMARFIAVWEQNLKLFGCQ